MSVSITFTDQEAQSLMQILMQAPLPALVSQPLITRIGQAIQQEQSREVGQAAGPRVVSDEEFPR
jgi:hypothetical protein